MLVVLLQLAHLLLLLFPLVLAQVHRQAQALRLVFRRVCLQVNLQALVRQQAQALALV